MQRVGSEGYKKPFQNTTFNWRLFFFCTCSQSQERCYFNTVPSSFNSKSTSDRIAKTGQSQAASNPTWLHDCIAEVNFIPWSTLQTEEGGRESVSMANLPLPRSTSSFTACQHCGAHISPSLNFAKH